MRATSDASVSRRRQRAATRARAIIALALSSLTGCGARFAGGVYREGDVSFRVGALPLEWRAVRSSGGALAFHHAGGGAIQVGASCDARDDVPLDALTNHLLIGFEDRRESPRERVIVDGRGALRTRLRATLDGVPIALELVVLKKDRCVYDLELVADVATFDARRPDFARFVDGFGARP